MNFYKFVAKIENVYKNAGLTQNGIAYRCKRYLEGFNSDGRMVGFVVDNATELVCALAVRDLRHKVKEDSFPWQHTGYKVKDITYSEITSQTYYDLMLRAQIAGFIGDIYLGTDFMNFALVKNGVSGGILSGALWYREEMLNESYTLEEAKRRAQDIMFDGEFLNELDRIYSEENVSRFVAHPVHYTVRTDSLVNGDRAIKLLISSLYENHRLLSKRYCVIDVAKLKSEDIDRLKAVYGVYQGATVILYCKKKVFYETKLLGTILNIIKYFSKYTLTVISCEADSELDGIDLFAVQNNLKFITFDESALNYAMSVEYLNKKVGSDNVQSTPALFNSLKEGGSYTVNQLDTIYENWFTNNLNKEVYPAYATVEKNKISPTKIKGASIRKLMAMIGLKRAKSVIRKILAFYKVKQLYGDKGFSSTGFSMHMCFTGNPGCAKTSVARLFANVMKENGFLKSGQFVEVGRADLVAQFVGQTAPKVKAAFEKAKGGVLFIDEAYSMVEDKNGSFGDEAIATIVQEMENNREDTCVIFAGYPAEMQKFLDKNPGLRSRIAFHVPFDDYSVEELVDITKLIASESSVYISEEGVEKLSQIFAELKDEPDFGNGRAARNMLEKARLNLALRLIRMDYDEVTEDAVCTILPEDIEAPEANGESKHKLGFAA